MNIVHVVQELDKIFVMNISRIGSSQLGDYEE